MKREYVTKSRQRTLFVCRAALIAALYVVLTLLSAALGLSSGVIQIRFSEALCVLPVLTTAAIPGLALGCFVANLLTGALWQDMVFGTLATLLGALGTYWLRRTRFWHTLPPVLSNALIIPLVLAYAYGMEEGIPFMALTVGLGEAISVSVLGLLLLAALRRCAVLETKGKP